MTSGAATAVHALWSPAALAAAADEPIVVLVHGAMDRSTSFGRTVRLLPDLPVVRYDRRGYGTSTGLGVGDLADHVSDLEALTGGRPCVVVGHSIGGVIALVAAQADPSVLAVGAWEAPMAWLAWWPESSAGRAAVVGMPQEPVGEVDANAGDGPAGDVAERFMRRMIGDERWARLPSSTRAARRAEGPALIADVAWMHGATAPYDAAELTQPVLAGYGSASKPYHQRAAEELAAGVRDGELMVVEGADHGAHLSHPQDFAQFVRRTVARAHRLPGHRPSWGAGR